MDRINEALEQVALDASKRRRYMRSLLRDYMQAHLEHGRGADPFTQGMLLLRIIQCRMVLRAMGFKKFGKLRAHVNKLLEKGRL